MTLEAQYLYAKDAIFRLICQFAHVVENSKEELCYCNLCESALERAFNTLGIEENMIPKTSFYKMWDDNDAKLREAGIPVPEYHHYEWYLKEKDSDLKKIQK